MTICDHVWEMCVRVANMCVHACVYYSVNEMYTVCIYIYIYIYIVCL